MKKVIALLIVIFTAIGLVGCERISAIFKPNGAASESAATQESENVSEPKDDSFIEGVLAGASEQDLVAICNDMDFASLLAQPPIEVYDEDFCDATLLYIPLESGTSIEISVGSKVDDLWYEEKQLAKLTDLERGETVLLHTTRDMDIIRLYCTVTGPDGEVSYIGVGSGKKEPKTAYFAPGGYLEKADASSAQRQEKQSSETHTPDAAQSSGGSSSGSQPASDSYALTGPYNGAYGNLSLGADGSFTLSVNVGEGYVMYNGVWQQSGNQIVCSVSSCDSYGFLGDNATVICFDVGTNGLSFVSDQIGLMQTGSWLERETTYD